MKFITIEEIKDLDDGFPVTNFKGTILSVFPPKTGSSGYGDWQVQSAKVTDGEQDIQVSFMNFKHPDANGKEDPFIDLRNYVNTEFSASCSKSDKHGFLGVTTNDYTNNKTGKTERQLKITEAAKINLAENSPLPDRPNNSVDTKTNKTDYSQQQKETKESYEKQSALKAAVEFYANRGAHGGTKDAIPSDVVDAAKLFYGFFTSND